MPWQTTPVAALSLLLLVGVAASTKRDAVMEVANLVASESSPLTVLIISLPTSGHLAVPTALGEELARHGHNVTLASTAVDGVPNRPKIAAERAGISYLNAGPTLDVARQIFRVQLDVFGRNNVALLVDNGRGNEDESLIVIDIVIRDIAQMISMFETYPPEQWDVILADYFFGPLLTCICLQSKAPVIQLNTGLQFEHLPPWPFPHLMLGYVTDAMTFTNRLNEIFVELTVTYFGYAAAEKVKAITSNYCEVISSFSTASSPGERFPQIVPTVIGFEFPRTIYPLVEYVGPILSLFP